MMKKWVRGRRRGETCKVRYGYVNDMRRFVVRGDDEASVDVGVDATSSYDGGLGRKGSTVKCDISRP